MKTFRLQVLACVVLGSALGYFAANGQLTASATAHAQGDLTQPLHASTLLSSDVKPVAACCLNGGKQEILLADADVEIAQASKQQKAAAAPAKKPNILFIMGDDIEVGCSQVVITEG